MNLGERIRFLREANGLSLKALSNETGIAKSTLNRIELNQVIPSVQVITRLIQYFQVSAEWMLFGSGEQKTTKHPSVPRPSEGSFFFEENGNLITIERSQLSPSEQEWLDHFLRYCQQNRKPRRIPLFQWIFQEQEEVALQKGELKLEGLLEVLPSQAEPGAVGVRIAQSPASFPVTAGRIAVVHLGSEAGLGEVGLYRIGHLYAFYPVEGAPGPGASLSYPSKEPRGERIGEDVAAFQLSNHCIGHVIGWLSAAEAVCIPLA